MNYKVLFSLLVFVYMTMAQNSKSTVAILDFDGQDVSSSEVKTLTERMRTEIGNTNAIRLIERKAVEKIIEEQGLQQSGCTTDECAVEVGQLLGVQFMISGSIGKMGDSYTIDVKMFSVESGETVRTKNATHSGDIAGLLTEMEILAWEIVGLDAPTTLKLKRAGTKMQRTVAVLDFEGLGITSQEAQALTNRFTTALSSTKKVILVERGTMNDVLEEQGFEAGECTSDECAAEIGAMLGVEYMVSGSIGKIGNSYTIDAKMFSVATGAAESMKNITYAGAVDGLIIEIEVLAWDILGLKPPRNLRSKRGQAVQSFSTKRKTKGGTIIRSMLIPGFGQLYSGRKMSGYAFIGLELTMIGLAASTQSTFNSLKTDQDNIRALYNASTKQSDIQAYASQLASIDKDMQAANDQLMLFSASAAGLWALNVVHAVLTGPRDNIASLPNIRIAYDSKLYQTQLKWVIPI